MSGVGVDGADESESVTLSDTSKHDAHTPTLPCSSCFSRMLCNCTISFTCADEGGGWRGKRTTTMGLCGSMEGSKKGDGTGTVWSDEEDDDEEEEDEEEDVEEYSSE